MPVFCLDVKTTVADREVELAVGPHDQPMQVVPDEADVDSVAGAELAAFVGLSRSLAVAQQPQIGDTGVPDVLAPGQHAGAETVLEMVKAVGEYRGAIGLSRVLGVLEQ